jgi:glycerophosphoryl diester phosphodiesterase
VLLVGHRGARGEAPENTVAGFEHALAVGVDALELDVRLCADGELVVVHDDTLDRTTDAGGPVAALTAPELARVDARGSFPVWPEPVGVPTLGEVLDRFAGRTRLAIEVKRDAPDRMARVVEQLVAMLRARRLGDRVLVTSFEPQALATARRLAPELPRAYIGAFDSPEYLGRAAELDCAQVDVPVATGSAEVVRAAQALGMRVCGWLGNTPDTLRVLVGWGVDAITTDYPTMAARELGGKL